MNHCVPETKIKKSLKGYIFVCTQNTEAECFERLLFGSSKAYGSPVLKIRKGDVLFLHNLDTNTISGVFRATSKGKLNIEPDAWSGKYPYQVKFDTLENKICLNSAKRILRKLEWSRNVILSGGKLSYLLDMFAYEAASLKDLLLRRRAVSVSESKDIKSGEGSPLIEATTLWDFSKQSYGINPKGDNKYAGVTPALVIYNLLWKYTEPGDLVVDPMCGSGTSIDVCKEENRKVIGYDISPTRDDIIQNDAREIPLEDESVDMVFIDPPYGDNLKYNEHPDNIGKISSDSIQYYDDLEKVMIESHRVLKKGKILAWLIGDQWLDNNFTSVGFRTYERLCKHFEPVDIICVSRRGQSSHTENWINRSRRLGFYLRGFKYLIIVRKNLQKQELAEE